MSQRTAAAVMIVGVAAVLGFFLFVAAQLDWWSPMLLLLGGPMVLASVAAMAYVGRRERRQSRALI
jgi:peptidoglycan/LPS O-acetylase OafA/YrhL